MGIGGHCERPGPLTEVGGQEPFSLSPTERSRESWLKIQGEERGSPYLTTSCSVRWEPFSWGPRQWGVLGQIQTLLQALSSPSPSPRGCASGS